MKRILSFGVGVQSSTLLYMSGLGKLPKLDAAIFADPQWESEATYAHLEFCKEFAAKHGIALHVRTAGNLRQDLIDFWGKRRSADGKRHASIPAFIKNPDGSKGIVRRQCTGTYKIDVVERFVREEVLGLKPRQRWPLEPVIEQWIGISSDEFTRRRRSERPAIVFRYPLLDDLHVRDGLLTRGFSRNDCLTWIRSVGLPIPPRSACLGCPFHSDTEWAAMKANDTKGFADACEVDRMIRLGERSYQDSRGELRGEPYLHSSLIPLELVEFKPSADRPHVDGMVQECTGMCGL